jgi:hypothetical protein
MPSSCPLHSFIPDTDLLLPPSFFFFLLHRRLKATTTTRTGTRTGTSQSINTGHTHTKRGTRRDTKSTGHTNTRTIRMGMDQRYFLSANQRGRRRAVSLSSHLHDSLHPASCLPTRGVDIHPPLHQTHDPNRNDCAFEQRRRSARDR